MKIALLLLCAILTTAPSQAEAPAPKSAAKDLDPARPFEPTTTDEAKLDAKGRVIFYQKRTGDVALRVGQDFAMMVFYNKYEENARPFYRVFSQPDKTILRTESFADFSTALDRIPAGSNVFLFDLCTSGSHYGMPPKYLQAVRGALAQRKLKLTDPGYIICTCP